MSKHNSPIYATIIALFFLIIPLASADTNNQGIHDSNITLAVVDDLYADSLASAHLIDVKTKDGIVALSGSVDNLLDRDRAVEVAESIKGVRAVVNEISIKAVSMPDNEIRNDVRKAFALDPVAKDYRVDVEVHSGIVTLSGEVASWAERQLAVEVVKAIKGVRDVKNEISINYNIERNDQEIKNEIERRLDLDPYVDNALIDVNVQGSRVALTGTVGSAAEKSTAYGDSWVGGVTSVDINGLEVKWWMRDDLRRKSKWAPKSDEEIKGALVSALMYDPRVKASSVDVTVDDGLVTLTGTVDNLKSKEAAEQDAKNTIGVGVGEVQNYLKVRPVNQPPNYEIAQNITDALVRNPILEKYVITVLVRNQKVYLYGTLFHIFEKNLAQDIASRVPGVVDVENNITVNRTWKWRSDNQIKKNIERQFFWSPFVDSDGISIDVKDGTALLSGTVSSWHELKSAVQNAFEGGAKYVRSHLKIKQAPDLDAPMYHDPYYWGYYWGYPSGK